MRLIGPIAALVLAAQPSSHATSPSPWMEFHSAFWINLHHFLYVGARALQGRDATRSASVQALRDLTAIDSLPESERAAFRSALAYYDSAVAKRDILFDSSVVAIDRALMRGGDDTAALDAAIPRALAAALENAAPAYRQMWWSRHDAANRHWIESATAKLERYGDTLAQAEMRLFREAWPSPAVRVDVSAYANWAGAFTTGDPAHVIISSIDLGTQGDEGFETLFHEVLHTMDDSLYAALRRAADARHKSLPRDPTHPFIFYTAGELTRRVLPNHVPYAQQFGLWTRVPDFRHAQQLLLTWWQPYLDGKLSFDEAIAHYVEEL